MTNLVLQRMSALLRSWLKIPPPHWRSLAPQFQRLQLNFSANITLFTSLHHKIPLGFYAMFLSSHNHADAIDTAASQKAWKRRQVILWRVPEAETEGIFNSRGSVGLLLIRCSVTGRRMALAEIAPGVIHLLNAFSSLA
jgi:hypothetical protein